MDNDGLRGWLLGLLVFLSLPAIGLLCSSRSVTIPPTLTCDQRPHVCHIITYHNEDTELSNDTFWACANGADTSFRLSPDCCSDDNRIDAVVNLTKEATTKIDCSLNSATSSYTYMWRMDAPSESRILLRVPYFDDVNTLIARDFDDSDNTYIFTANNFVTDGDSFLSSSNAVNMEASFKDSAQTHKFIVIGRALDVFDTSTLANITQECMLPSSTAAGNQWDSETACEDVLYTFQDSCYQFSRTTLSLSGARSSCERIGYHLVYIESREEQAFLSSEAVDYWIGIEQNEDGEQVWMDGSAITYMNFDAINDGGHCFRLRSPGGEWADRMCERMFRYICERERGYRGNNPSQGGCIAFSGKLPVNITNKGAILVKFRYFIKTYENSTVVWTGNHVIKCLPDNSQALFQNGLQINISCDASLKSSGPWAVTFQAKGAGLIQIDNVELIIYNETESRAIMQQTSGQSGTAIAIVMVLLVIVVVAVAGVTWYRRRKLLATSDRKPQLENLEGHVQNHTYENRSVRQGDQSEYADSRDSIPEFSSYVNNAVISRGEQLQQDHPGAGLPFPGSPASNNGALEEEDHAYSVAISVEEEDENHEYNIPDRGFVIAEGYPSTDQDLSRDGERHPPKRIVVSGVNYALVDLTQKVKRPDTTQEVSRDGKGHPPKGIWVNGVKYSLVDLEQKVKKPDKPLPTGRKDNNSMNDTTGATPDPYHVLQRGCKPTEQSPASGYGSLWTTNEDLDDGSRDGRQNTIQKDDESFDQLQHRPESGPPNQN